MPQDFKTAREVSEHLLDLTGRALLTGNFQDFLHCFCIPTEIQTFEGRRRIASAEDVQRVFDAVRRHYEKTGVTDMVRYCVEAEYKDPQTIMATHETRLVSGHFITRRPFPTLSVLKYNGTHWQIASSSYAIEDHKEHNSALMCAGEEYP